MNTARDWEFLIPWFERLRSRLRSHFDLLHDRLSSHPVRVGLDVADWWIFVDLTDDADGLDDSETTVQQIREALLLVAAFARINRVCCWQFLQGVSLFDRAAWMDLDDPAFHLQFVIDAAKPRQGDSLVKKRALMTAIDGMLVSAHADYSNDFVKDWTRVLAMCDVMGLCIAPRQPVLLRILFDLHSVDEDHRDEYCGAIVDGIFRIQSDQMKPVRHYVAELLVTAPRFQVAAMDLYIGEMNWSASAIRAMQRLTDLDVPLHTVELPPFKTSTLEQTSVDCRPAWCNLLRSLTSRPSSRVRRLVVPREYAHEPLRSSLFSALVESRGMQELEIKMDTHAHPLEEATEMSLWAWIGSAVFCEHPTRGAIESLTISGVLMTTKVIKALTRYQSLRSLVEAVAPGYMQGEAWTKRHERVTVTSGTELKIFDGCSNRTTTISVLPRGTCVGNNEQFIHRLCRAR